jgi:hypothetical protein
MVLAFSSFAAAVEMLRVHYPLDFRYRASALPVGTLDDLETPIGQFADFAPSDARLEVIPQRSGTMPCRNH